MKLEFPKPKRIPLKDFPYGMSAKKEHIVFKNAQTVAITLEDGLKKITIDVPEEMSGTLHLKGELRQDIFSTCIIKATVQRNAKLEITESLRGGSRADTEIIVELIDEGAECNVIGRFHGTHESHHGFFIIMRHVSRYTKGNIELRGVYEEKSRGLFSGLIKVDKNAQKTNSYFRDDVLLLDQALAESLPTLEIEANDVKASHGSTTTRINDEQIFYLQSRGIKKSDARTFIIEGFLQ